MSKADYVAFAAARHRPDARHTCHWTGCDKPVPPAMWGCKQHWFKLPAWLRAKVWRAYRPGQEVSKDPSQEYLDVAREVQNWIAAQGKPAIVDASSAEATLAGLSPKGGSAGLNASEGIAPNQGGIDDTE